MTIAEPVFMAFEVLWRYENKIKESKNGME